MVHGKVPAHGKSLMERLEGRVAAALNFSVHEKLCMGNFSNFQILTNIKLFDSFQSSCTV